MEWVAEYFNSPTLHVNGWGLGGLVVAIALLIIGGKK